tara:strand:+ start:1238 stop:1738 length:501 start_codon:yes stop_codon:yes gene_type:complete
MVLFKRKIFYILVVVFTSISCYSQSKTINGILIKVPEGFVYQEENKTVDIWLKNEENIAFLLQYYESSKSDYENRKAIKLDSETTEYIDFGTFEILKKKYDIQINMNYDTQSLVAQTLVYRDGYMYIIIYAVGVDLEKGLDKKYATDTVERLFIETIYFIKMILTS